MSCSDSVTYPIFSTSLHQSNAIPVQMGLNTHNSTWFLEHQYNTPPYPVSKHAPEMAPFMRGKRYPIRRSCTLGPHLLYKQQSPQKNSSALSLGQSNGDLWILLPFYLPGLYKSTLCKSSCQPGKTIAANPSSTALSNSSGTLGDCRRFGNSCIRLFNPQYFSDIQKP